MPQSRQLAAIMFTDIVGYTALMGKDEDKAFELLAKNRLIQKPIIETFNGRFIKELGDGMLAYFNTVSDAVKAAEKIQEACNAAKDFQLRIGIHQGEVVFEANDIFGDAVNIASRIQAIASPGTIYVSESVHNNISNKKEFKTRFVKEEMLKNVKDPVRIYEVLIEDNRELIPSPSVNAGSGVKNFSDKSIAVLPLVNMSSDAEQEYFSDGLTEEIITDLSRLEKLLVISRSSVMTFKGTHKKIKVIANEVGVRYILEGSVRRSGNNLRITAQLIDALNDSHIWAERYNGTIDDIFDIQEKVSRSIVDALDVKLTSEEDSQLAQHSIQNTKAYECYLRARQEIWRFTPEGFDRDVQLVRNALTIVGANELLFATLGTVYWHYIYWGIKSDDEYLPKLEECTQKVFHLNGQSSHGFLLQAWIKQRKADMQESVINLKKSLEIEPNNPDTLFWACLLYSFVGKIYAARPLAERLLQVDPLMPINNFIPGTLDWFEGKLIKAIQPFRTAFEMDPQNSHTQFWYAYILASNNYQEEALGVLNLLPEDAPQIPLNQLSRFLKLALRGENEKALKCISPEVISTARVDFNWSWIMLDFFALINEKQEALKWLENSIRVGVINYPFLAEYDPFLQNIRGEEWFSKQMMKAKEKWEAFQV